MPQSTTTYATISSQCQNEMGDTGTDIWASATLLSWVNEATYDIIDDLMYYRAVPLFDYLLDSVECTLTNDTESVDYDAAISGATKTIYKLWKFTWNDRQVNYLDPDRWWEATEEHLNPSNDTPYYTFSSDGTILIRPKPTTATTSDFYCWWVKQPTAMTASDSVSSLSEPCARLYRYVVARNYYRGRGNYKLSEYYDGKYEKLLRKILNPYRGGKLYRVQSTTKM